MFSWEIEKYIVVRGYNLTPEEFTKIVSNSPQIKSVDYVDDESGYNFLMKTDDNFKWKVKVLRKELKNGRKGND